MAADKNMLVATFAIKRFQSGCSCVFVFESRKTLKIKLCIMSYTDIINYSVSSKFCVG